MTAGVLDGTARRHGPARRTDARSARSASTTRGSRCAASSSRSPRLRERYLAYVRDVAATWLDWKRLGPIVARYRALIEHEVEIDTRKLSSFEAFRQTTSDEPPPDSGRRVAARARGPGMALRAFADQRRKYLLDHPAIRALPAASPGVESRAAPGGK